MVINADNITKLSEPEKNRLIELLIEVFDAASYSEDIYFTNDDKAIEILTFIKVISPENANEIDQRIENIKKATKS